MEWLVVTVKAILDFRIRESSGGRGRGVDAAVDENCRLM